MLCFPQLPSLLLPAGTYSSKRSDNSTIEFATIPVQSVGYDDAKAILDHLSGPEVPSNWKKSLGKRVGPARDMWVPFSASRGFSRSRFHSIKREPDALTCLTLESWLTKNSCKRWPFNRLHFFIWPLLPCEYSWRLQETSIFNFRERYSTAWWRKFEFGTFMGNFGKCLLITEGAPWWHIALKCA